MNNPLIGNHPAIRKIRELIKVTADTGSHVLILGETGTGKEVVARFFHHASGRRKNRFIKINCAALPIALLESELFGYERGAFTGAVTSKAGKFELASDGVIFLDEIGDMPLMLQAKLLQVIQSGEFTRLGGIQDVKVNCLIISATNHDIARDMQEGSFREDLYYRLNIIKIIIPPLRDRTEDIPILTNHFLSKYREEFQILKPIELDDDTQKLFQSYPWPGNVRELSSIILRLVIGDSPEKIRSELINDMQTKGLAPSMGFLQDSSLSYEENKLNISGGHEIRPLKELKAEASNYIEKKIILYALEKSGWNKKKTAEMLQISYKALFNKLNDIGISNHPMGRGVCKKQKKRHN